MLETVIFLLAATGCMLCVKAFSWFKEKTSAGDRISSTDPHQKLPPIQNGKRGAAGCCPVCGSRLPSGFQIKTVVYPPASGSTDRVCRIFGCPYCYPVVQSGITRCCPVCNDTLESESFLIARMFDRGLQKNHVHINGCIRCAYGIKMK